MANYVFVNSGSKVQHIATSAVTSRGAWSNAGTYVPDDVVTGTLPRTSNFIALGTNTGQALPVTSNGTWSLLIPTA